MRSPSTIIAAALSVFGFGGCSTHPIIDDVTRKSTYDVVEQIRCEAGRAVRDYAPAYVNAAIAYEFEFVIREENNANAAGTLTLPFVGGGQFTVDLADPTQFNKTREAKRNFRIVDSFTDAKSAECLGPTPPKNIAYPISGDIGVYEVVKTFVRLAQASTFRELDPPPSNKPPPKGEVFMFADTLEFRTTLGSVQGIGKGAGVHPELILQSVPRKARITSASGDFTVARQDTHKVTIAIAGAPLDPGKHPVLRGLRMPADARGAGLPGAGYTNNAPLATTLVQARSPPEQMALIELDRQRILALQRNTPNLLVTP